MHMKLLLLSAVGLSLAACGDMKDSFDKGVEDSFAKEFVDSCVTSAVKTGAAPAMASKLCKCTADKLQETHKGSELLSLSQAQMEQAAKTCLSENGIPAK